MQVFPNPDNPIWTQTNTTDLFGNLYATRNINLDREGYIGLSKRTTALPSSISDTVQSMCYNPTVSNYRALLSGTGTGMININPTTMNIAANADINSNLNDNTSRIIFWNNTTYYTRSNALKKLTGATYNDVLTLTTTTLTGNIHCLCAFENKTLLAISDGNLVRTLTTADAPGTTLTLPIEYSIVWIKYFGNKLYIGANNKTGNQGMMFVWSGATTEADSGYPFFSAKTIGGEFINSTIYLLNQKGQLLQFTGGGFNEVAIFPFRGEFDKSWLTSSTETSMAVMDGSLIFGIDNKLQDGNGALSTSAFLENFYLGVWMYDPKFGLTHKYSVSDSTSSTSPTDYGILYNSSSISVFPFIEPIISGSLPDKSLASRLFISSSSNTSNRNLVSLTTGENRGYFQTKKIMNTNVKEINKKLFIKYRNVDDSNDKIIVKYKDKDVQGIPNNHVISCTFTNQSTFTTTDTIFSNVIAGYEIELLDGPLGGGQSNSGSGSIAHISSISYSSPTYTVVLDENIVGTSPILPAYIKVDNFKKLMTIDSTTAPIDQEVEIPIDVSSKWISIKVEMRGEGIEIEQMILVDAVDTPAT